MTDFPTTVQPNSTAFQIHRGSERGHTRIGWLDSRHSFAFGQYRDPARMGFGPLRVINDDRITAGAGFGEHPHQDMEILTWVLNGALKHGDSLDNAQTLGVGELQAMSAGTGIVHSEFNASDTAPAHFLQIWIQPRAKGLPPRYQQRAFPREGRLNQWQTLATNDEQPFDPQYIGASQPEPLAMAQDATLKIAEVQPRAILNQTLTKGRSAYLHVATGSIRVSFGNESHKLQAGDALSLGSRAGADENIENTIEDIEVILTGDSVAGQDNASGSQVLWFDLSSLTHSG